MMLHTKYQGSKPYGFRLEDFFMFFPIEAYVKTCYPFFWPQGYKLNKLGRGLLGDASYQISRLLRQRRFFRGSPYISLCKTCDPLDGAIFDNHGRGPQNDATYQISRL